MVLGHGSLKRFHPRGEPGAQSLELEGPSPAFFTWHLGDLNASRAVSDLSSLLHGLSMGCLSVLSM